MTEKSQTEPFDWIQSLIGEYETKTTKPTLEGFSMFLERRKQHTLFEYRKYLELRKRK